MSKGLKIVVGVAVALAAAGVATVACGGNQYSSSLREGAQKRNMIPSRLRRSRASA